MYQRLATELDCRFIWIHEDVTRSLALAYGENATYIVADRHGKAAVHALVSIRLIPVFAAGVIFSSSSAVLATPRISGERKTHASLNAHKYR